jgi:hypothetical protein
VKNSFKPDHIWIDIQARSIKLNYDPSKEFIIIKRTPDTFGSSTKGEEQGTVFIVRDLNLTEWFERILHELSDNFVYDFIFIARNILIIVAIGGGAGIFTAFILVLTRLTRLFGGKHWTYFLLKRLNGKLGRLISFMPIFDFDGEFYVEERFVNIIDFSSIRTSLIELYKQRWYDILIFPTALASILTILFVQNYPGEDKIQALAFSPLFSPIVLILLLVYFPAIWAYNEGGFKRIKISPQGDIVAVKPLGKIMRDGLGIIIGFSGILSLGALAAQVTRSFTPIPTTTGQIQVAGFPIDLFGLLLLLLWTFGLFFLLLGSVIVGASLLAINNLLTTHLGTIEFLRRKSAEDGVINNWGSVSSQFAPVAKETLFSIEKPKKNK